MSLDRITSLGFKGSDQRLSGATPSSRVETGSLLEANFPVKTHLQAKTGDLKRHPGRENLIPFRRTVRHCGSHGLFDVALRIDAHHLQELPDAEIEGFLVHTRSPWDSLDHSAHRPPRLFDLAKTQSI